jgi:hypothetical protein
MLKKKRRPYLYLNTVEEMKREDDRTAANLITILYGARLPSHPSRGAQPYSPISIVKSLSARRVTGAKG